MNPLNRRLPITILPRVHGDAPVEQRTKDLARVGAARACDFFRCARGHDASTVFTTFRTKIDNVVGAFDYVEIVFDHQHRIAERDEPLQHVEQFMDVSEMQPRRRLVEDVDGPAGCAL